AHRAALGVASAPDERRRLEADEIWFVRRGGSRGLVALSAEAHDLRRIGQSGTGNREVRESLLHPAEVMRTRAVAAPAADAVIAGLRASFGPLRRPEVGGMAVDAQADRFVGDGPAQEAVSIRRCVRVLARPVPLGGRGILGDSQFPGLTIPIAAHEG